MAVSSASLLLLRRGRAAFSALRSPLPAAAAATSSLSLASAQKPPLTSAFSSSLPWNPIHRRFLHSLRGFSSAVASASSSAAAAAEAAEPAAAVVQEGYKFGYEEHKPRDLGIDEIEGCDFNHWLIVIDFPKDPRPSHEEMVRFYEETCAKALNLSLEEAKKKIYACSTSNYTGFHVEVTEIESEKFNGQPGVVFVLPDSYVDKEKKEYGGDKYINGIIIPRPRPTLNGRHIRDDFKQDKQRRPMPDRQGSPSSSQERPMRGRQMPNQQMQSSYSHEGPTQGRPISNQQRSTPQYSHQGVMQGTGGNHGAPQNYVSPQNYGFQSQGERRDQGNYQFQQNYSPPVQGENRHQPNYSFEQNYGPPGQGERSDTMPMMSPGGRSPYQQGNGSSVPYQGNYNRGWAGNFHPHEYREFPQGYQMNYAPSRLQGGFREDYQNYRPAQGTPYGQGAGGYRGHGVPEAYYHEMDARSVQQGYRGPIHRPPGGYQGQGVPEVYWQGMDAGSFQQGYREPIQSQAFSQVDQRNFQGPGFHPQEHREFPQGYQRNYAPPVGYQGGFREEYRYYGPTNVEPYGQGSAMIGYQGQRAPEAYWQGTNYGTVGYGYDGPIGAQSFSQSEARNMQAQNFYSQGSNEFPHGGQRSYTSPRYEAGFRQDHQNYGPPQGTPYRQEDDGYQGQGPPMAYWRGPKF